MAQLVYISGTYVTAPAAMQLSASKLKPKLESTSQRKLCPQEALHYKHPPGLTSCEQRFSPPCVALLGSRVPCFAVHATKAHMHEIYQQPHEAALDPTRISALGWSSGHHVQIP